MLMAVGVLAVWMMHSYSAIPSQELQQQQQQHLALTGQSATIPLKESRAIRGTDTSIKLTISGKTAGQNYFIPKTSIIPNRISEATTTYSKNKNRKGNLVGIALGVDVTTPFQIKQSKQESSRKNLSQKLQECNTILKNPTSMNEMIYWDNHNPMDYQFIGANPQGNDKYLTFEPDTGGWNSQHMVLESMVVLALSLGRTLVLPPKQGTSYGTSLSYEDFIDLKSIAKKYEGFKFVTTEVFLTLVAGEGHLLKEGKADKPPNNQVNWDNTPNIGKLFQYLRDVGQVPFDWDPQTCILGIPFPDGRGTANIETTLERIWKRKDGRQAPFHLDFQGKPTPVNAPLVERLREFTAERKKLCTYDGPLEKSTVLHIPTTSEAKSLIFAPFYAFVFFEDYKQDLLMKRMVRNEMRYNDDVVCAAGRIVESLRALSTGGTFYAFHIRGAAFENAHHDVHEDALWILNEIRNLIPTNSTVFVSSDEVDPSFFTPLSHQYSLYFASDFSNILSNLHPVYLELVQQLVCARSETFIGTFYSSFSGYINRLRGYYSTKQHLTGYEDGKLNSYYHSPASMKKEMRIYRSIRTPFYIREWPTAWRDIDRV